jgi:hypothetical protein
MKKRVIVTLLLALTFVLPMVSMAVDQEEPTIYVIKRGDTLWGLSERFIKDPYYWPNMWSANEEITNPHFIYPGQKVRVFADRLEFVPKGQGAATDSGEIKAASNVKAAEILQQIAEEKRYSVRGSEGFLMEKQEKPFGFVVGIHHDRIVAGYDDIVYTDIGTSNGVKGGEKFSVFKSEGDVSHPVTNEILGKKMIPLGRLQLTDLETNASRGIVTQNFREITAGSFLFPFKKDARREVTLKKASRELKGYIVESNTGTLIVAAGDIVYLDLGSSHGAEPGNMLYIARDVVLDKEYTQGKVSRLPQELLGAVVILETGKRTATAIVVKSIDAIYKGDKLISHTK